MSAALQSLFPSSNIYRYSPSLCEDDRDALPGSSLARLNTLGFEVGNDVQNIRTQLVGLPDCGPTAFVFWKI